MNSTKSYGEILRSSSITGGAQGLCYLVGLIKIKVIAVLLGPAGVGLISLYTSAMATVGALSNLGIGTSAVREVAQVFGHGNSAQETRTITILRRLSLGTGMLGWGLAAVFAYPISMWVFGTSEHALSIALLGVTLLMGAVTSGQTALLQGVRRIGDLARISVWAAILNTALAVALFLWLGERGILPVLIGSAVTSLLVSWLFARRLYIARVAMTLFEALAEGSRWARLGVAVMWSGILTAGLDLMTRSIIAREHGLDEVGVYQAAWMLSGVFAGFVLAAMGTDFYPRLSGLIHDKQKAIQTVNEQTEIGVLLAVPGLLGTLALGPIFIELFYSEHFLPGAALLPGFLFGVLGRVVSWPLGYILLANGEHRWYIATETTFVSFHLALVMLLVPLCGVVGASYAFAITYTAVSVAMLWVAWRVIGFRWSLGVRRLLASSIALVLAGIGATFVFQGLWAIIAGLAVTILGTVASVNGLSSRLEREHPLIKAFGRIPGSKYFLGHP